jgi:hypothetical protein
MAIVLAIGTTSTAIVYAASNSDDNPGNGDTQPDSAESNSDDNTGNGTTISMLSGPNHTITLSNL